MTGLVAGIGFKAIAGAVAGKAASAGKSALSWLGSLDLVHALLLVAALFGAWQTAGRWAQHRHTAKVEAQLGKCTIARASDAATYAKAQADAATQNKAQVAVKEAQSKKVSDDERQAYLNDFAKLRADDQRMRQQVAAAKGGTRPANPPAPSAAASGTDANGLPLPPDEHLQAAEIELRLMHLQRWVLGQLAIDPNKDASK